MATVEANFKEEFLINGEWVLHEEELIECDSYENLCRRQGCVNEEHIKRTFRNCTKVEIETFVAPGGLDQTTVRRTITWP